VVAQKQAVFIKIQSELQDEHKRILSRKLIIERRKERQEYLDNLKIKEQEEENQRKQKERDELELKRINEERQKREEKRKQALAEEKARMETAALAAELSKKQGTKNLLKNFEDKAMDPKKFLEEQIKELNREKDEMERRLHKLAKMFDHLERAKREAELPLLATWFDEQKRLYQEHQAKASEEFQEEHRKQHAHMLEIAQRLARMNSYRVIFEKNLDEKREKEYKIRKEKQDERMRELRLQIEEERTRLRHLEERKRREQEERKKKQEEERRRKEEEDPSKKIDRVHLVFRKHSEK